MTPLSTDFAPSLRDPGTALAVVEVVDLRNVIDSTGETESGLLDLVVRDAVRGPLGAGAPLSVPFRRRIDARGPGDANDGWDEVLLVRGALLLLALRPTADPTFGVATAARSLASLDDDMAVTARRCLALDALAGPPDALRAALVAAILSERPLEHGHALLSLQDRGLGREQVISVLEDAGAARSSPAAAQRIALALVDARLLQADRGADRTNARVVAALARGLGTAREPSSRMSWARGLEAAFARFRRESVGRALVLEVEPPIVAQAAATLATLSLERGADRKVVARLLDAFRGRAPSPPGARAG